MSKISYLMIMSRCWILNNCLYAYADTAHSSSGEKQFCCWTVPRVKVHVFDAKPHRRHCVCGSKHVPYLPVTGRTNVGMELAYHARRAGRRQAIARSVGTSWVCLYYVHLRSCRRCPCASLHLRANRCYQQFSVLIGQIQAPEDVTPPPPVAPPPPAAAVATISTPNDSGTVNNQPSPPTPAIPPPPPSFLRFLWTHIRTDPSARLCTRRIHAMFPRLVC